MNIHIYNVIQQNCLVYPVFTQRAMMHYRNKYMMIFAWTRMIPNSPCKVGLATPQDVEAGPEVSGGEGGRAEEEEEAGSPPVLPGRHFCTERAGYRGSGFLQSLGR